MSHISPSFLRRFQQAGLLASAGYRLEALTAYETLFAPLPADETAELTFTFRAVVQLRRAVLLGDLRRDEEARLVFEGELRELLPELDPALRFEYFLSFGNTLGRLGRVDSMVMALTEAVYIAQSRLLDLRRCEQAWKWMLHWCKVHQSWALLERKAREAHALGVRLGSQELQLLAGEFAPAAWRALGEFPATTESTYAELARHDTPN